MSIRVSVTNEVLPSRLPLIGVARSALTRLVRRRTALVALVVLGGLLGVALAAPIILPMDPNAADFDSVLEPPSFAHILGTDQLGRDLFTRVIYGGRVSFLIGVLAVSITVAVGVPIGLVSGYFGGLVNLIVQRFVELLLAFPNFLLALTLIAVLGVGVTNAIVAVALATVPFYVRLVRSVALSVQTQMYVEAARALVASEGRIVMRHVFPNCLGPIIVQSTLQLGTAILTAAGLGFLGLGVKPPTPEWGTMLGEGQTLSALILVHRDLSGSRHLCFGARVQPSRRRAA
jgi:ABC-type dipeptide/oligopeptide/nickel transport system permease subunit